MINITLPDGSRKKIENGSTPMDIAKSISEGLARNVLCASVNGEIWDSNRPSVLIWGALQDESGNRSLLSSDINNDIIDLIADFADARGPEPRRCRC